MCAEKAFFDIIVVSLEESEEWYTFRDIMGLWVSSLGGLHMYVAARLLAKRGCPCINMHLGLDIMRNNQRARRFVQGPGRGN